MTAALYDRDIREPLFLFLEEKYGKVRFLEEKITGSARADAVMVTEDALYGIEIKSDQDTYTRLPGQIRAYDEYYDYNYAVVGLSHVKHIEEHLPPWWGIITAERDGEALDFYILRRPRRNPGQKIGKKVSLLWRPEMEHILERARLPMLRSLSKARLTERLPEMLDRGVLDRMISDELFERDYTLIAQQISDWKKAAGIAPRKKRRRRIRTAKRAPG